LRAFIENLLAVVEHQQGIQAGELLGKCVDQRSIRLLAKP
jgi:hypothetical protein